MDVGAAKGCGTDPINGNIPKELRETFLQRCTAQGFVGMPSLCPSISLPQEDAGGKDFYYGPGPPSRHCGFCAHPLWLHSDGEDKPAGNRGGIATVISILFWH